MDKTNPIEKSEADECIANVRKTIADATALELNGNWEKVKCETFKFNLLVK